MNAVTIKPFESEHTKADLSSAKTGSKDGQEFLDLCWG